MALAPNRNLADIFGPAAKIGTGATLTASSFSLNLLELGKDGNVTSPANLSPEGILLAILQVAHKNRSTNNANLDAASVMLIDKATPTMTQRGNADTGGAVTVRTERYTITFYSTEGIDSLDPDFV